MGKDLATALSGGTKIPAMSVLPSVQRIAAGAVPSDGPECGCEDPAKGIWVSAAFDVYALVWPSTPTNRM